MRCGQHRSLALGVCLVICARAAELLAQQPSAYTSPFAYPTSNNYRPFGTSSYSVSTNSIESTKSVPGSSYFNHVRMADRIGPTAEQISTPQVVASPSQQFQQSAGQRPLIDPPRLAQRDDGRDELITGQVVPAPNSQTNSKETSGSNQRQTPTSLDLDPTSAPFTLRNNGTYSALPSYGGTRSTTTFSNSEGRTGTAGNQAAQETKPWSISATQTVDYVKNLALPINLLSNNIVIFQNDWQYQTSAQGQYRIWKDEETSLVGYTSYYQSIHPVVTQQDLNVFSGGMVLSHKFNDSILAALTYDYSYYYLDQRSLFSANRLSPSVQFRATKCVDYQLSYSVADSNYRNDPFQTSVADFLQIQRIGYFDEQHLNYWFLGYQFGYSDAGLDSFAYEVRSVYLGTKFVLDDCKHWDLFSSVSYGTYEYQGFDVLEPFVIRDDDILTVSSKLSRTFGEHCSIFALYTFTASNSTVMRQNYNSELYSVGISLAW